MLYSVVDDRSGVAYQEYRCVYGEDVENGLRFLFNATAPKEGDRAALQGIPEAIYLDNGPIARSGVFRTVMDRLGVRVLTHLTAGKDGRRTTARSKGKVERPFRTVKEARKHFIISTSRPRRPKPTIGSATSLPATTASRIAASRTAGSKTGHNLPATGIQAMCTWERFCAFAREPERRKVATDARVRIDGAFRARVRNASVSCRNLACVAASR